MTKYEIGKSYPLPKAKPTTMRDLVPNGEDFRSKLYTVHRANVTKASSRMSPEYYARMALTVECRDCAAAIDQPCTSIDKTKFGAALNGPHGTRLRDAMRVSREAKALKQA